MGPEGPLGPRRLADEEAPFGPSPLGEAEALAVLVSVEGVGPVTIERLTARLGGAVRVVDEALRPRGAARLIAASAEHDGVGRPMAATTADAIVGAARRADVILDGIRRLGLRIVAMSDDAYPARLRLIELPPPVLFVRGEPAGLAAAHAVAVVGTRRPTDAGRRTATRISAALSRAGAVVVSGLAVGIDGAAHAAVVAEGGSTVAVIGSGHARLFPRAHARLADEIVGGGGAVISEHAPETVPTRGTFPRRNRIISGLADAVVVVEAGARSGALVTANWALEQGREVFAVPASIDAPASAGCLALLREWVGLTRIVAGVPQLLDDLGLAAGAAYERRPARHGTPGSSAGSGPSPDATMVILDPADRLVAAGLVAGAGTVDELVAVSGATVAAVLGALTRLEGAGLATGGHGRWQAAGALAVTRAA